MPYHVLLPAPLCLFSLYFLFQHLNSWFPCNCKYGEICKNQFIFLRDACTSIFEQEIGKTLGNTGEAKPKYETLACQCICMTEQSLNQFKEKATVVLPRFVILNEHRDSPEVRNRSAMKWYKKGECWPQRSAPPRRLLSGRENTLPQHLARLASRW